MNTPFCRWCGRPTIAFSLCAAHYKRFQRGAALTDALQPRRDAFARVVAAAIDLAAAAEMPEEMGTAKKLAVRNGNTEMRTAVRRWFKADGYCLRRSAGEDVSHRCVSPRTRK